MSKAWGDPVGGHGRWGWGVATAAITPCRALGGAWDAGGGVRGREEGEAGRGGAERGVRQGDPRAPIRRGEGGPRGVRKSLTCLQLQGPSALSFNISSAMCLSVVMPETLSQLAFQVLRRSRLTMTNQEM